VASVRYKGLTQLLDSKFDEKSFEEASDLFQVLVQKKWNGAET
jgi:hypothetical protein